jgi:ribulose-phosphate 3-epimerase
MQAWVSLWSADLLDVGRAVDLVDEAVDGYHVDVFDGHDVDDLLFGPDFVTALRQRTRRPLEVHLIVLDPDHWATRFIDVGADIVTVQSGRTKDLGSSLHRIAEQGAMPSLGVQVHEDVLDVVHHATVAERYVLMGTAVGIKGVVQDHRAPERVATLRAALAAAGTPRPVVVDGGIRAHTVAALATAGADGVVPGSLVFGAADPVRAIHQLHALGAEPM